MARGGTPGPAGRDPPLDSVLPCQSESGRSPLDLPGSARCHNQQPKADTDTFSLFSLPRNRICLPEVAADDAPLSNFFQSLG